MAKNAREEYNQQYAAYIAARSPADVIIERKIWELEQIIKPGHVRKRPPRCILQPKPPATSPALFVTAVWNGSPEEQIRLVGQPVTCESKFTVLTKAWSEAAEDVKAVSIGNSKYVISC